MPVAKSFLAVFLVSFCVCGSALSQTQKPIGKENLLRALRIGGVSSREYVRLIDEHGVDFLLTASDERDIRRAGKYLGKKGLDDLVAAVRGNYRADLGSSQTVARSLPPPNDFPLSFLRDVPVRGGSPQKLDDLMKAAGYVGPTLMAVLIVANNDVNNNEIIIGTRPDLNARNSQPLMAGDSFNFPGGENTSRVYVLSNRDGKVDITYRQTRPATKPNWDQIEKWVRSLYPEGTLIDHVEILDDPQCKDGCQKCIVVLKDSNNNTRNESVTVTYQFVSGGWEWKAEKEHRKQ